MITPLARICGRAELGKDFGEAAGVAPAKGDRGGALVALGLFTRPVAFILSGQMAVAYFMIFMPKSFWPAVSQGDAAILFCFVLFYLVFAGPGPWSLDAAIARRRRLPQKEQPPARPDARPRFTGPPPMHKVRPESQSEHTPVRP
jgi:hypothetical protein